MNQFVRSTIAVALGLHMAILAATDISAGELWDLDEPNAAQWRYVADDDRILAQLILGCLVETQIPVVHAFVSETFVKKPGWTDGGLLFVPSGDDDPLAIVKAPMTKRDDGSYAFVMPFRDSGLKAFEVVAASKPRFGLYQLQDANDISSEARLLFNINVSDDVRAKVRELTAMCSAAEDAEPPGDALQDQWSTYRSDAGDLSAGVRKGSALLSTTCTSPGSYSISFSLPSAELHPTVATGQPLDLVFRTGGSAFTFFRGVVQRDERGTAFFELPSSPDASMLAEFAAASRTVEVSLSTAADSPSAKYMNEVAFSARGSTKTMKEFREECDQ